MMSYLVCPQHRPIHLTCEAGWLAGALSRKGAFAQQIGPVVETNANTALVEYLITLHPPRIGEHRPVAFRACALS